MAPSHLIETFLLLFRICICINFLPNKLCVLFLTDWHVCPFLCCPQARAYARAMKATLFFSSATHNINVNKIFKFITAKLFNLPWTVERNLTIGEPIIDF